MFLLLDLETDTNSRKTIPIHIPHAEWWYVVNSSSTSDKGTKNIIS